MTITLTKRKKSLEIVSGKICKLFAVFFFSFCKHQININAIITNCFLTRNVSLVEIEID